jgi:hypothetical protein
MTNIWESLLENMPQAFLNKTSEAIKKIGGHRGLFDYFISDIHLQT